MTVNNAHAPEVVSPSVDARRWLALPILLIGPFLTVFDFFVVNVSLPSLQTDLRASPAQVQAVVAGYGIAYAVLLITGGRLGDLFGRKRIFLLGLGGFVLASAACGLAQTPAELIVARIIQGALAAIMFPQALSLIHVGFLPAEKGLAFGSYGMALGLASILGPLVGGLLISANWFHLVWRPIFLLNFPIGCIAFICALPLLRESRSSQARRLDLGGVALLSLVLLLLLYPLLFGNEAGWPLWAFLSLGAFPPALLAFTCYETWVKRRGGAPLVEFALFRDHAFRSGLLIVLAYFAGQGAFFFLIPLYLQQGLHFTAQAAGDAFVPFAVGFFLASLGSAKLAPLLGRRLFHLGICAMILGILALLLTARLTGSQLQDVYLIPALFLYGCGQGSVTAPLFNTILQHIRSQYAGLASGLLSTTQQLASAIGVVGIGALFFHVFGTAPSFAQALSALFFSLLVNIGLLLLTFLLLFLLPRKKPDRKSASASR